MKWGFTGSVHPLFLVVVQAVGGSSPLARPSLTPQKAC
jgi:hypothetical protein